MIDISILYELLPQANSAPIQHLEADEILLLPIFTAAANQPEKVERLTWGCRVSQCSRITIISTPGCQAQPCFFYYPTHSPHQFWHTKMMDYLMPGTERKGNFPWTEQSQSTQPWSVNSLQPQHSSANTSRCWPVKSRGLSCEPLFNRNCLLSQMERWLWN